MPRRWPTARAVVRPSPVAITTRRPALRSAASASAVVALIGSDTASSPASFGVDGQVHHAGALAAQGLGLCGQRRHVDAELLHQRRVAQREGLAADIAAHADARARVELLGLVEGQVLLPRRSDDGGGQRVLAALVETGRQAQHLVFGEARGADRALERRPALGQRAGLVDDQGVDLAQVLDRGGVAEQHAIRRAAAGGDHDRHRRGQAERTGAGDDQHRHRIDQAVDPAGSGPKNPQPKKVSSAMATTPMTK